MEESNRKMPNSLQTNKAKGNKQFLGKRKNILYPPRPFCNTIKLQRMGHKENPAGKPRRSAADVEDIISSGNLPNSLEGMGSKRGSAALNLFLSNQSGTDPALTTGQVLQIMESISPKILLPPQGSPLHQIAHEMQKLMKTEDYSSDHTIAWLDYGKDEEIGVAGRPEVSQRERRLYRMATKDNAKGFYRDFQISSTGDGICSSVLLADTFRNICMQEVDKSPFYRRQVKDLSSLPLLEKFQELENKFCESKIQEERIIDVGKRLGLVDYKRMNAMKGYLGPMIPPYRVKEP